MTFPMTNPCGSVMSLSMDDTVNVVISSSKQHSSFSMDTLSDKESLAELLIFINVGCWKTTSSPFWFDMCTGTGDAMSFWRS